MRARHCECEGRRIEVKANVKANAKARRGAVELGRAAREVQL